jgi:hypothetical protein
MSKRFLVTASIIMLFAFSLRAAEPIVPISKDTARNAIAAFRQDPFSPRGRAAGEVVRSFAEKDTSVLVEISSKVVPFLDNIMIPKEDRTLLLDAFVVGNVDSQFLRNEKKDDPYSGVTEVIQIYQQMQKKNPGIKIKEVDNFIDMEKRGELKKYVASP